MTAPEWISSLGDRDPSVAIALAAITKAAGPGDVCAFADLVMTYREAHLACYNAIGVVQEPEITGDEVRDHLRRSVLPRLAVEGWLIDTSASDWDPVTPRVAWWGAGGDERRELIYQSLLAAAQRAAQRSARQVQQPAAPKRTRASVLEGLHLVKSFKDRRVVNEVSVKVEQGEIVGLLGPNGAGKTTTFYLITGLIRPDAGQVRLDGLDLTRAPMYERARAGIGYLAQEPSIFRKMTVEENILAILETRRLGRDERQRQLDRMLDELSIKHLRRSRAYSLSGGERRRLEITRALVTEPKFMLLDEPFAGVDPIAVHDIQTIVAGLRHRGIGVLITDHNVEQTLDIVDRAYIMFEGKVQAAGKVSELVYDDRVAQLYLGPTLTARLRARLESVA
ncbi:MAG TPA: LPS export ABC transporter ATP-binding protein [Gemmatimonadales bacterium]|jgi:lipopolysaccharide export system ATP-binding protein|nr:LPS export ABC transporter ATP-binding protein [Gemmatimonadales bacterium]